MRMWKYRIWTILWAISWCGIPALAAPSPSESAALNHGVWNPPQLINWGGALQGKRLHIACVVPSYAVGDIEALGARFKSKTEVYALSNGHDESDDEIGEALKSHADVLLVAGIASDDFSDTRVAELIKRNRAGEGVVWIRFGDSVPDRLERYLDTLVPSDSGDWIASGVAMNRTFELHVGVRDEARFVDLNFGGAHPLTHALFPGAVGMGEDLGNTYENGMSLIIRCLLWAADAAPEMYIQGLKNVMPNAPDLVNAPPQLPSPFIQNMIDAAILPPLRPYLLEFSKPLEKKYRLKVQARYPNRDIRWSYWENDLLRKGARFAELNMPLGRGLVYLDFWLMDGDRTVDWFTKLVTVEGWPKLSDVRFSKYVIRPNDTVELVCTVRTNSHRSEVTILRNPVPPSLRIRAQDSFGRLILDTGLTVSEEGGEVRTLLHLKDVMGPILKIEMYASTGEMGDLNKNAAERTDYRVEYFLVRQNPPTHFEVVAQGAAQFETGLMMKNSSLSWRGIDTLYTDNGAAGAPAIKAAGLHGIDYISFIDISESGNWFGQDPNMVDSSTVLARRDAIMDSASGGYDGHVISEGFGLWRWIAGRYGDNASTRILFRDWLQDRYFNINSLNRVAESDFVSWEEVDHIDEGSKGNEVLGVLSRNFRERVLLKGVSEISKEYRERTMGEGVGIHLASIGEQSGVFPWSELGARLDFAVLPNDELTMEKVAAFVPRDFRLYASLTPDAKRDEGTNGSSLLWNTLFSGMRGVWIDAAREETVSQWFDDAAESIRQIRQGIDVVIEDGDVLDHKVVVVELSAVRHVVGPLTYDHVAVSQRKITEALRQAGYRYTFVQDDDLATLLSAETQAVVLPTVVAMSAELQHILMQFVDGGGVIVADALPGTRDELGREGSSQLGQHPEVHVLPDSNGTAEWAHYIHQLFSEKGIAPDVSSAGKKFKPLAIKTFGFRYDRAQVYGAVGELSGERGSQEYQIEIPEEHYVYDMLEYKPVKVKRELSLKVKVNDVRLISVLPYEVSRVIIQMPEKARQGQQMSVKISIKTRGELPGDHVVFMKVRREDGTALPWYDQSIVCKDGVGETYIPLSLNEIPGKYQVIVRDVLTGVTGTGTLQISPY